MTKMKEIEEFVNRNGNVTYTVKELIQAMHTKLDRVETKLEKLTPKSLFWRVTTAIGGIITFLAWHVFK